jgi:transcriptional regulator with XRE-family HTH domain
MTITGDVPAIIPKLQLSTDDWEERLGSQFRALRIRAQLDQATLADRAAVSLGSVKNLEQGRGSSLRTIICVAIALDRGEWLESLAPAISVSPIDLLRSRRTPRSRVYRSRKK